MLTQSEEDFAKALYKIHLTAAMFDVKAEELTEFRSGLDDAGDPLIAEKCQPLELVVEQLRSDMESAKTDLQNQMKILAQQS